MIVQPRSVNVSLNGVAEFSCRGIGSLLGWSQNTVELTNGKDGVTTTHETVDASQDLLMSTLSLPVSSINASNITCTAARTQPLVKNESEPALLLVQGV